MQSRTFNRYAEAYVLPIYNSVITQGFDTDPTLPSTVTNPTNPRAYVAWSEHTGPRNFQYDAVASPYFGTRAYRTNYRWIAYVTTGFEPVAQFSGDASHPDQRRRTLGATSGILSVVFVESGFDAHAHKSRGYLRDIAGTPFAFNPQLNTYEVDLGLVTAHEVGHQFGLSRFNLHPDEEDPDHRTFVTDGPFAGDDFANLMHRDIQPDNDAYFAQYDIVDIRSNVISPGSRGR
jgi:hypothetical protein